MAIHHTIKWLMIGLLSAALSGCFGGTIAQQVVRAILIKGADKATAAAVDAHERKETQRRDAAPDKYKVAFVNSGFENVTAQIEPLPVVPLEDEKPIQVMQETQLVQVEVWNMLVGDEKQRVLEKARMQGAISIPPKDEWQQWQLAIGGAENIQAGSKQGSGNPPSHQQQVITFLIPPDFGKMHSGAKALVELSNAGELSIARYTLN